MFVRSIGEGAPTNYTTQYFEEREHAMENMAVRDHEREVLQELKKEMGIDEKNDESKQAGENLDMPEAKEKEMERIKKEGKSKADTEAFEKAKHKFSGSI
jgi:hypothetical protein